MIYVILYVVCCIIVYLYFRVTEQRMDHGDKIFYSFTWPLIVIGLSIIFILKSVLTPIRILGDWAERKYAKNR